MKHFWKINLCSGVGDKANIGDGPVDFDDAIAATGFGKFNVFLILYAIPAAISCMFDTTTMSYVVTSAECDLRLSLIDKGVLNGITHLGMISSAFLYGYLTDTLGRRKVLVCGFILDSVCNLCAAFSQNFATLVTMKFVAGFAVSGPCTILVTCLSEFFPAAMRPTFVMYIGMCFAIGNISIPLVAWSILERPGDIALGSIAVMHSWQLFIVACAIPSLVTGSLALLLPESPRFLLSRGRKEDALKVLRRVYAANTSLPPDSFPVKDLKLAEDKSESGERAEGALAAVKGGLRQLRPLFRKPYLFPVTLVMVLEFGAMMGCNTLRLWLPQMFQMMSVSDGSRASLCDLITVKYDSVGPGSATVETDVCEPIGIDSRTFVNTAAVACIQFVMCTISSFLIGSVGKKSLLMGTSATAGVCGLCLYLTTDPVQAIALSSVAISLTAVNSNTIMSVIVDLFPTKFKATATSVALMSGRTGSIGGNLVFPLLLARGCAVPFAALGATLGGCALLSLAVPKPGANVL